MTSEDEQILDNSGVLVRISSAFGASSLKSPATSVDGGLLPFM